MTEQLPITLETVASAVMHHLHDRTVVNVEDRGVWIRHNFRIALGGGEIVHLKVDQSFEASEKEAYICELLHVNGLPVPRVFAVDATCTLLPAPFVIQEHIGGERLGDLLDRVGIADKANIYSTLGRFYGKLHRIHHDHSGWIQGAGKVLPFPPNDHQYDEVIVKTGGEAVARGLLTANAHRRVKRLWSDNMMWLNDHQPSLVTGGALHWTVYLARDDSWHVTKIMDLGDLCYWDPAWDLVSIKYPSFREPPAPELWESFISEYGSVLSERRLKLYLLMQRISAAMGNYLEPATPEHTRWKESVWETFDSLLDEVERLQVTPSVVQRKGKEKRGDLAQRASNQVR